MGSQQTAEAVTHLEQVMRPAAKHYFDRVEKLKELQLELIRASVRSGESEIEMPNG